MFCSNCGNKIADDRTFNFTTSYPVSLYPKENTSAAWIDSTYIIDVTGTVYTDWFRRTFTYNCSMSTNIPIPEGHAIVTMQELNNAYEANRLAADSKYANQYLNVSGTISEIGAVDAQNMVNVELKYYSVNSNYTYDLLLAYFKFDATDDALYDLNTGDDVTFTGYLNPSDGSTVYDIMLTYVPATDSPHGVDTIYMESHNLFNMTYTRHPDSDYFDPYAPSDPT